LNNAKHKKILEDMAEKGFLDYRIEQEKNQSVLKYRISEKGIELLKEVFERYELLFPRGEKNAK
jgi:DNA-binding PadR family transcriptional regulator